MIARLLIRESPAFREENLEFDAGFNIFSGASGAGKSLLMESILALFGIKESNAGLIEATLKLPYSLQPWGIDAEAGEEAVFLVTKKDKVRYFVNNQNVPKKRMREITQGFVKHVSPKNAPELESKRLLALLDSCVSANEPEFAGIMQEYGAIFAQYTRTQSEFEELCKEESRIEELKDFARFEIEKISAINPKKGEYEELMNLKKSLSKREKIKELMGRVERFLEGERAVLSFLELTSRESALFSEAMSELALAFEEENSRLLELEDMDIERLLERLERLSELKRRYGGEEEALEYLTKKRKELAEYENIHLSIETLRKECERLLCVLNEFAERIHIYRERAIPALMSALNAKLSELLLKNASLVLRAIPLGELGSDEVELKLGDALKESVSSGEFNRLRLAFLELEASYSERLGILILDEIDANLSGEESEGVAKALKELSRSYQVLAISHQPHMPSYAHRHFLVKKELEGSVIRELDRDGRMHEIARMVSGSEVTKEALEFAKKRLEG